MAPIFQDPITFVLHHRPLPCSRYWRPPPSRHFCSSKNFSANIHIPYSYISSTRPPRSICKPDRSAPFLSPSFFRTHPSLFNEVSSSFFTIRPSIVNVWRGTKVVLGPVASGERCVKCRSQFRGTRQAAHNIRHFSPVPHYAMGRRFHSILSALQFRLYLFEILDMIYRIVNVCL